MDHWFSGSLVFIVLWWLIIFMVLPFGVRPSTEVEMEPGQEPGAPHKPMLWRKVVICTAITAVVWLILYFINDAGLITFRPD